MTIDRTRLAEFQRTGAHWTAGPQLLRYLKEEAGWDPTPEQELRDAILVQWLSGELSHDESTKCLSELAATVGKHQPLLTPEANSSLQSLLRPIWSLALRTKNRELEDRGADYRPRPKLARSTCEPLPD